MKTNAIIICGGPLEDVEFYKSFMSQLWTRPENNAEDSVIRQVFTNFESPIIICADSGYANAKAMGVIPHVVIGDFDSFKRADMPDTVRIQVFPEKKDHTDTHLAVLYALEKNVDKILLLCALGGRFDHSLANLNLLQLIKSKGKEGWIIDHQNLITLASGKYHPKELWPNGYISIIPLTSSYVTINGLAYELDQLHLTTYESLGISNRFKQEPKPQNPPLLVLSQDCLIIQSKDNT